MTSTKKLAAAAVLAGLLAGAGALKADTSSAPVTMKPSHGVSFDVGAKRAVGYFLSENGHCRLTLTVADAFGGQEIPSAPSIRFETAVGAGKSAQFATSEGKALEFTCQPGAHAMNVAALDRVAANAETTQ